MSGKNDSDDKRIAEDEQIAKAKTMLKIMEEALDLQEKLNDGDANVARDAEGDAERLVERFYDENRDMTAPQQYEAAKKDFEYFMTLVELALKYYEPEPHPLEKHIYN